MYRVELSREAQRFFDDADAPLARRLARRFEALEADPRAGNNVKPLKGPLAAAYRYRVGDHRVVYTINQRTVTVFVITIAKRSDVYE
jgi:mRNA interferase RelE/StbE